MMKKWKAGMIAGLLCTFGITNTVYAEEGNDNKIHFINVSLDNSGSDAILLESNGHYAMIDTGEDYDFPDGSDSRYPYRDGTNTDYRKVMTERVMRHLKNIGVQKLEFILVTHAHSDHIGNADELMENFSVDKVFLKRYSDSRITDPERVWDSQYEYDKVLSVANEKGIPVLQDITKEQSHFFLGDMEIQLYNYENQYTNGQLTPVVDDNSNSIISLITVNGKRIFTAGDLNNLDYGNEDRYGSIIGKVDLMKFNHHYEARYSNTYNFLKNLHPSIVVQTSNSDPWKNNQVATDVIDQLHSYGATLIKASSNEYNATVFDIRKDGIFNITTMYPHIPKYEEKWYQEDGAWKYQYTTGEHAIGWSEIGKKFYFFKGNGEMLENQWKKWRNRWFYLHQSGEMATNWNKINGKWYYFNEYGQMETGWIPSSGAWYYLTTDGNMVSGWKQIDKAWYYFAESGEMKTGWLKENNQWYFLNVDGSMSTGKLKLEQNDYLFADDGHMLIGWQGKHYYKDSGEQVKNSWIKDNDNWYYFDSNGELLTNTITPEGYTVDEKGIWKIDIPKKERQLNKNNEKELKSNNKNDLTKKTENIEITTVEKNNH